MKKCFTITVARSKEDIKKAEELLVKTGIYQGCELFYPYEVSEEVAKNYEDSISCFSKYPDFNVVLHLPYGSENNPATYNNLDRTMKRLFDAVDFAAKHRAIGVTLHPGELDGSLPKEEAFNLSVINAKKVCDYAAQYGITVMIENMVWPNDLCLTIAEMKKYQEAVNKDNVGITLDCGHYHASHQEEELKKDLVEYVMTFKNKIQHLHLHDNFGLKDEHKPIGSCNIDFASYFKALRDINFDGTYGSEVLFKDYSELLETAKKMDEFNTK